MSPVVNAQRIAQTFETTEDRRRERRHQERLRTEQRRADRIAADARRGR